MAKEKFGIAVDEETVREVDELVSECRYFPTESTHRH
jgi:hypothetical protein